MIYYKTVRDEDPYFELWSRDTWLQPIENADKILFPLIVTVEPTNKCNLKCLYCCRQLMDRRQGHMSLAVVERIAAECAKHKSAIRHGGFGEPLFHPEIVEIIHIIKSHGVLTTIFTNGAYMNEAMARAFIECGLDEIRFSSAGISEVEHDAVRQKSDYAAFWDSIKMVDRLKREMGSGKPYLTLYSHVLDYGADEFRSNLDAYVQNALRYVDKVDIDLTMYSRVKELDHVRELYKKQTIAESYRPCVELFLKTIVHWNGDVYACDMPYNVEPGFLLGNLGDPDFTLEKGVNSARQRKLRQDMCFDTKHADYPMCRDCYSNTIKWDAIKAGSVSGTIFENALR